MKNRFLRLVVLCAIVLTAVGVVADVPHLNITADAETPAGTAR